MSDGRPEVSEVADVSDVPEVAEVADVPEVAEARERREAPGPVHYVHIVTGDDGETHLRDVALPEALAATEHGVPPLLVSEALPVDRVEFVGVDGDGQAPGWHNAPRRQLVVFLSGWVRIEVSDGEVRTLPAGSVVLADDRTGPGHVTTHEPGPQRVLVIPLEP